MRLQFVFGTNVEDTIDIDVADVPTKEQAKAIENDIYNTINEWEEESGNDFKDFDFYMCCYNAVQKHIHVKENKVIKTFYIEQFNLGEFLDKLIEKMGLDIK